MEWATKRIPLRLHSKTRLIPAQLFELEKSSLNKLPPYVSPPSLYHERETDQYGYAAFDGNYYWIPGTGRGKVQVIQFSEKIQILRNRELLKEYTLPIHGVKNERFRPDGIAILRHYPQNCKRPTEAEENRLKAIDPSVAAYLEFIVKASESSVKKYRLIRELFSLSSKVAPKLFIETIQRAHTYRIMDRDTIERIAIYLMRDNGFEEVAIVGDYEDREIYREGRISPEPDLSKYDELLEKKDTEEKA